MGKGKGKVARYCSRTLKNHNLFEFSGFNIRELFLLKRFFNKKINIPVKIYSDFFVKKSYFYVDGSEKFFFFKKYFS